LRYKDCDCCALQFISRPFVVGDRIEISSVGGSKFVVGTVERVDPMRTIIRTDSCMPITIPNKVGAISSQKSLQENAQESARKSSSPLNSALFMMRQHYQHSLAHGCPCPLSTHIVTFSSSNV